MLWLGDILLVLILLYEKLFSFGVSMNIREKIKPDQEALSSGYVYRVDNYNFGPPHPHVTYLSSDDLNQYFHSPLVYHPIVYHGHGHSVMPEHSIADKEDVENHPRSEKIIVDQNISVEKNESNENENDENENENIKDGNKFKNEKHESKEEQHESDDESSSTESENSEEYEDKFHKKSGDKKVKNYSKDYAYSRGRKGSYDREYHSDSNDKEDKSKKSEHNSDDSESEYESEDKKKKEGKYGSKKHHQKGSKSNGYHNIFMKDEYKKDHTFYDVDDHSGHYSKKGSNLHKHSNGEEHKKKHSYKDEDYEADHNEKHGDSEKNNYDKNDAHYKKENGNEEKHENNEEFSSKGRKTNYHVAIYH